MCAGGLLGRVPQKSGWKNVNVRISQCGCNRAVRSGGRQSEGLLWTYGSPACFDSSLQLFCIAGLGPRALPVTAVVSQSDLNN